MRSKCPRILYVSSCWLHGATFGGQLRALYTARALQHVGSVTVTVVSSDDSDEQAMRRTAAEFNVEPPVCVSLAPNQGLIQRLRWAFDPRYLNVHGCIASAADRSRVTSIAAGYDLTWILNGRTPNILQQWKWLHSHLDIDDVPSTYLRTVSENGANIQKRAKARIQRLLLKRREMLLKKRFTTLSVCSEADRVYLGGDEHIHVIPNGFERPACEPAGAMAATPPRIGFIGLLSYAPNREGVAWFLKECWPLIRQSVPGVRFRLAGKGLEDSSRPSDADVDVLGWIDDPAAEIATWSAMVIPIRCGGGTRIKIADAFSRKCPVVSTRLGAFGYDVKDGNELKLADTPEAFAQACITIIRDVDYAKAMAQRAYHRFLDEWTWDAIAPRVWRAAEDCLRRSATECHTNDRKVMSKVN